jgi:glutamate synthase domain-containing protein 3
MIINAEGVYFKDLNQQVRESAEADIVIDRCFGQRFIASGLGGKNIVINGTPGNALAAYLDGSSIIVNGNVQDAVGDTMDEGLVVVHGSAGDALGYSMRGGKIYVRDNSGYRTGIHMKQYKEKKPVIIVGGGAGSFLGEYMAGGIIIVLGLYGDATVIDQFTGAGMHGGKIFIRSQALPSGLPPQVAVSEATAEDLAEITGYIEEYTQYFALDYAAVMQGHFYLLKPNAHNPYTKLYTIN